MSKWQKQIYIDNFLVILIFLKSNFAQMNIVLQYTCSFYILSYAHDIIIILTHILKPQKDYYNNMNM